MINPGEIDVMLKYNLDEEGILSKQMHVATLDDGRVALPAGSKVLPYGPWSHVKFGSFNWRHRMMGQLKNAVKQLEGVCLSYRVPVRSPDHAELAPIAEPTGPVAKNSVRTDHVASSMPFLCVLCKEDYVPGEWEDPEDNDRHFCQRCRSKLVVPAVYMDCRRCDDTYRAAYGDWALTPDLELCPSCWDKYNEEERQKIQGEQLAQTPTSAAWQKFCCPDTCRIWWWREKDGACFFEGDNITPYMDPDTQKVWYSTANFWFWAD